jgi:hypothetical protein
MESFEVGQRIRIVNPQYLEGNGLPGPVKGIVIELSMTEWQRRMFLAREPKHPEEIKDMLSDGKDAASMQYNKDILEAFRRGQKSKLMVK